MSTLEQFRRDFALTGDWHYIYGLTDPRTGELRYIGKSDRPVGRLANQMNEHSNTHRCHWLQSLRSAGLLPVQTIIDAVPAGDDWQTVERAYIIAARKDGHPLTNGTDGGDGVQGLSAESRARISATWVGRKHRPESLIRIGAASRGRRHTLAYREYMREIMAARVFTQTHRDRIRLSQQRLSDDDVRAIRVSLATGERQRDIAARYGIHQGTVSNIARGVTYREVT